MLWWAGVAQVPYFQEYWNLFDLLNYFLFVLGFVCEANSRVSLDHVVQHINKLARAQPAGTQPR